MKIKRTTVVDNFKELGNVCGNDGSEPELDNVCAKKTNVEINSKDQERGNKAYV